MKRILSILFVLLLCNQVQAQSDSLKRIKDSLPDRVFILKNVYRDGEALPEIEIKEVTIVGRKKAGASFNYWKYQRLIYNVRRVYPYAVIVRMKLADVNSKLSEMKTEKERKEYMKQVEKEVFKDYEGDMRQMSITQGRLLIKLIDRETQNTSYELIKDYRGSLSAAFWQGIARIFGTNLKDQYDPYGEDALIERIIQEIEAGRL